MRIQIQEPKFTNLSNSRKQDRFRNEIRDRMWDFAAADRRLFNAAAELTTGTHCDFDDKCIADEFVEWLMTFESWTEEYCPIRIKRWR